MTSPGTGEPPAPDPAGRPDRGEQPWANLEPQPPAAASPAAGTPEGRSAPNAAWSPDAPPPAPSPQAAPAPYSATPQPAPGPALPPPPPGPGVQPPFPAPPEERNVAQLALGLLIGGLAVVVCLVGCVAGLAGVVVWQVGETNKEAKAVVTRFLDALVDDDSGRAEAQLCDAARRQELVESLTAKFPADLASFEVRNPTNDPDKLVVPATLTFEDGSTHDVAFGVDDQVIGEGRRQQLRYLVCGASW